MAKNTKKKSNSKKDTKKNVDMVTHVAIVLDRSGSMSRFHKQAVDGINEQFSLLRKNGSLAGKTTVSLLQFDDVIDTVFDGAESKDLPEWGYDDFKPRGGTAMNDAIWKSINHLKAKPRTENTAYLICVISDGEENSSKEVTQDIIANEIEKLNATGEWTFTYILGGITAQEELRFADKYKVSVSNIAAYNCTPISYAAGTSTLSESMVDYLGARSVGDKSKSNLFSNEQKIALRNS